MRKIETEDVIVFGDGAGSDDMHSGTLRLEENNGSFRLSLTTAKEKSTMEKAAGAALPAAKIAGRFALTAAKAALGIRGPDIARTASVKRTSEDWEEAKRAWQEKVYETPVDISFDPGEVVFSDGVMVLRDGDVVVITAYDGEEDKRILDQWKAFILG